MSALMTVYLIGVLVTFVAVLIATPYFDRDSGYRWRHRLAVLAALIWPILVVGVIQVGLIAAVATGVSRRSTTRRHEEPPVTHPVGV